MPKPTKKSKRKLVLRLKLDPHPAAELHDVIVRLGDAITILTALHRQLELTWAKLRISNRRAKRKRK
jgi:hypothetical protein